jgi:hypothetical protein
MRALLRAATSVVVGLALLTPAGAAAPVPAARSGAEWLRRLVAEDGSVPTGDGSADLGATASVTLALAAAGVGRSEVARATSYLKRHIDDYVVDDDGVDKAGALGKLALVARAAEEDPNAFGGTQPANRLIDRILATQTTSGLNSGLLADSGYPGLFTHSIAALGLATARRPTPQQAAGAASAAAFLVTQQCDDGGWQNDPRPAVAGVVLPCGTGPVGPDTNTSGLAAQAVAALKAQPRTSPLEFFDAAQGPDGGFGYFPGGSADADSTALSIQGVLAAGGDPGGPRFTGTVSAYGALLAFQIGCDGSVEDRGAFAFQPGEDGSLAPSGLATAEAVPAAAGRALPLRAVTFDRSNPVSSCSAPSRRPSGRPAHNVVDATVRVAEGYYPTSGSTGSVFYASEPCAVRLRAVVPNAYEALIAAKGNHCISSFVATQTPDGHYLTCVNGRCESPGFYWAIYRNGELTCTGIDEVVLQNQDEVAFSWEAYPTAAALATC